MKRIILLVVMVILMNAVAGFGAGKFDAAAFGADNTGKTDATKALQAALDACSAAGGGVVNLAAGHYLCEGSLTIPTGVCLQGIWEMPHHGALSKGTVLMPVGGRGDEKATPFLNLSQSSAVRGVTIWYPEQRIDAIAPYPWTFQGRGMHGTIENVTLVNAYDAIDFGTYHGELHYIKNVFGCILHKGVLIDQCTDIGRVEDVHFNPHYWARAGDETFNETPDAWHKLLAHVKADTEGFIIGKTDWEYMVNCFTIFNTHCWRFTNLGHGAPNAVLTQCGGDISLNALLVEQSQPHAGLQFVNCQFEATAVVEKTNAGPVKFTNCGFWPAPGTKRQAVLAGSGPITFVNCHFAGWDKASPAIDADCARLTVTSCYFAKPYLHLRLGPQVQNALIGFNQCVGGLNLQNESKGDVQVGFNSKG